MNNIIVFLLLVCGISAEMMVWGPVEYLGDARDFSIAWAPEGTMTMIETDDGIKCNETGEHWPDAHRPVVKYYSGSWFFTYMKNNVNYYQRNDGLPIGNWTMKSQFPNSGNELTVDSDRHGTWMGMSTYPLERRLLFTSKENTTGMSFSTPAGMGNCTQMEMIGIGEMEWLLSTLDVDRELIYRMPDKVLLYNESGPGGANLVRDGDLLLHLNGHGHLRKSMDGVEWSEPIELLPGRLSVQNQTWIIFTQNGSCLVSVDMGANWTLQSLPFSGFDKILGHESGVFLMKEGRVYRTNFDWVPSPVEDKLLLISSNETLNLSGPVNDSIVVEGRLVVSSDLYVNGNLTMNSTGILEMNRPIHIGGHFRANGTLRIGAVNVSGVLVTFASREGDFSRVEVDGCWGVEWDRSVLRLVEDPCREEIALWMYLVMGGVVVLALVGIIISLYVFRKKVFPYRQKKKRVRRTVESVMVV